MVEVIHNYYGSYPFNCKKQSENTYMQLSKCELTEEQIHLQRQKAKIYKNIDSPYFVKLIKTLKEDSKLHFIYEYEQTSLEGYIQTLRRSMEGPLSKEKYKFIVTQFKHNIDNIIDVLIKQEIKADVFLSSVACVPKKQKNSTFLLKAFIDPDAEYLSLVEHHYRPKDSKKKDKTALNQEFLFEFYEAERKRLMLDFQEILEKIFGKQENTQKRQFPNFVINGTKLVFINSEEKQKQTRTEQSEKKINEDRKINQIKESYLKEKEKSGEGKEKGNESKDRIPEKMEQSKTTGTSEGSRNSSPVVQKEALKQAQKQDKSKEQRPTSPIIDFDQSFQPEFKPEEFLKEKTYIYEEQRDYLDSLEEEINKMAVEKQVQQSKKNFKNEKQYERQPEKKTSEKAIVAENHRVTQQAQRKEQTVKKQKDLTISQGSTQSNTQNVSNNPSGNNKNNQSASLSNHSHSNNNISNENLSNNDSYQKKPESREQKTEKVNKYKMKIITSHQIEIEGGNEQPNIEEIEKEIIEGIRTGKININELAGEKNPKVTLVSRGTEEKDREKSSHQPTMYSSDHRDQVHSKDSSTQHEKKPKVRHDSDNGEANTTIKTKEIQMSKMKNISQILEKIGVRSNANPPPPKEEESENRQQGVVNQEPKKVSQPQPKIQDTPAPPSRPQKQQIKAEKPEKAQRQQPRMQNELADEKAEKTENYLNKIREAKNKAEQILRQYTKKKQ